MLKQSAYDRNIRQKLIDSGKIRPDYWAAQPAHASKSEESKRAAIAARRREFTNHNWL